MKKPSCVAAILMIQWIAHASLAEAFQCNVCHSKNPAMVRMHKSVQAKGIGCFDCHKPGEKLMGKARQKDRLSIINRRGTETPCIECHGKTVSR